MERLVSLPQRPHVGCGRGQRALEKTVERAPGLALAVACVHEGGVKNETHPDLQLGHMGQRGQLHCPEAPGTGPSPQSCTAHKGTGPTPYQGGKPSCQTVCLPPSPLPQRIVTEGPCWTLDTEGPENPVLGFRELLPQAGAGTECRKTGRVPTRSPWHDDPKPEA